MSDPVVSTPTPSIPLMGFEGYAYCAAAGSTPSTEMKNVRALKVGMQFSEVDTTVQGNRGVKSYSKGLKDCVLAWDQVITDNPDSADQIILAAADSRTPIALHFIEKSGGTGPKGTFHVFGGEQTMDSDGVQIRPMTAKPATGYDPPESASISSGTSSP